MITSIEALNYRCLRYVRQPLGPFHVLVGPNASGKTTFLDVVGFLHDLVSEGLDEAITTRAANPLDLIWRHEGNGFELAIEARIPEEKRRLLDEPGFDTVRYEVAIRFNTESQQVEIAEEKGWLKLAGPPPAGTELSLFPADQEGPSTLITPEVTVNLRPLFYKAVNRNDVYLAEAVVKDPPWSSGFVFLLGPRKSTLANLPEDETRFPVSGWLKGFLSDGIETIILSSSQMRLASPPGRGYGFQPDGSNLPWVVRRLAEQSPDRLADWVAHLQTALPDLEGIETVVREDDRHCYLRLLYRGGLKVPSWLVSDGTLRLMALTLPAYLNELKGIYLIEEPENGIHPQAVDALFQSLSSVDRAQVMLATHSPVILGLAESDDVLCFAKTDSGASCIVRGSNHPRLRDWRGEVDLGTLFASGVLG